jgi:hypothetical protein
LRPRRPVYDDGKAVPQDYAEAANNRDIAAQHMTPAEIAEAQKLARESRPK